MTIANSTAKAVFSGNGSTTVFPLTSPAILVFDATHLVVTRIVDATGATTVLTNGADYSVSNLNSASGATVTTTIAPATGTTLVIQRIVPYTQGTDLQANTGLPSDTLEQRLDLIVMQTQQLAEQNSRTLRGNIADTVAIGELPTATARAGKVAGFDTSGNPTVSQNTLANIDTAVSTVLAGSNPAIGTAIRSVYRYSATAGQTTFSGVALDGNTLAYAPGLLNVRQNGLVLNTDDYTATDGTSIILVAAASLSDEIVVEAFGAFQAGVPNDGTVTTAKLATDSVTTVKIAAGAVTTSKVLDGSVTLAKLANLAQATFMMRAAGAGTGVPTAGTAEQAKAVLDTIRPAFSVFRSTTQSVASGAFTKVQFADEEFDTTSAYDNVTNFRFTPAVAGTYQLYAKVTMSTLADQNLLAVAIYKNGSLLKRADDYKSGAGGGQSAQVSALVTANTTDYFEVFVFHNTGSNQNVDAGAEYSYFHGYRV